jgi:hypothetical protein
MRRLVYVIAVLGLAGVAAAEPDPHAEMAAALAEQADLHPAAAVLPGTMAATKIVATPAIKHVPLQANLGRAAAIGSQGNGQGNGPSATGLAHQAAQAAAQAASQAQSAAAKQRHKHPKN